MKDMQGKLFEKRRVPTYKTIIDLGAVSWERVVARLYP